MNAQAPLNFPLGITRLTHLGVIRATGADAAQFLHGQLTQDILHIPIGHSRLAAWCSAKGRMLATFWVHRRAGDEFLLITSQDSLAATLRRLGMFVLRAQVRLSDASSEWHCWGHLVKAGATVPAEAGVSVQAVSIPLSPVAGYSRTLVLVPTTSAAPTAEPISPAGWNALDVLGGVAWVTAAVADQFVPQTVNFESVDGVHFQKGCYPGQEVVARSQFRGTVKRRGYLIQGAERIEVGQSLFSPSDPEQPCGTVVMAAPLPGGNSVAFASIQINAAENAPLHLGTVDGPALQQLPLPYPLRNDI